ncbi:MAG: hypothetical protein ACLPM3_13525 [Terracidiphilus sp.]
MKRDSVQTVTLPVLVKADSAKEADGWGTFLPAEFEESWFIRVVTPDAAKNWLRSNAGREDTALYIGASQLKGAYDARDEYVLRQAYEKLQPYVRGIPSPEPIEVKLGTTKNGMKIALRKGGQNLSTARDAYSGLMTAIFQSARFVMWFSEKDGRFLPALYCPDWRTAAFVVLFMGRVRVCPKCSTVFVPSAGNVDYCTPACREAHRVARFRWRAKRREEEAKKPVKKQRKAGTR